MFVGTISLGVGVLALIVTREHQRRDMAMVPMYGRWNSCIERDAERKANAKILQLCVRREMFSEGRSVIPKEQ